MSLILDIKKSLSGFDLELALEAGLETLGLLGDSGSGKSLTLRCIAGLETPDEGRIVVGDKVFFDSAAKINLSPQERKTAMLFQNYMLFPNLTVAENIAAGLARATPKDQVRAIVEEQLELFELKGCERRYPARLSGGEQQRVALARMLIAKPDILMLDEPFSALDSHLKSNLEHSLHNLFEGFSGTILYVTHDIDEALCFCDRLAVIEQGRLAQLSSAKDLLVQPKTLAALKILGVKNLSPAVIVDEYTVNASAWGLTFKTAQTPPRDLAYLGFCATSIERAESASINAFEAEVHRIYDLRFKRIITLKLLDSGAFMRWETDRQCDKQTDKQGGAPHDLCQPGDRIRLCISPERIHLV